MAKKPSKPKMGRPPLPPGKRRGASIGIRLPSEDRERLEKAAEANGRSMSQEAAARLKQSHEEDEAFGGMQFRALFRLLGNAAVLIEKKTGKSCFEDWNTWVAVQGAWKRLGITYGPSPPKAWRKALLEASEASSFLHSERPPKDADLDVREAYLDKSDKALQAYAAFHRYQEDDRVQEEFGREMAASLLPEKAKKGE